MRNDHIDIPPIAGTRWAPRSAGNRYRRAIPRILIAAAAAPKPLSMFITMTPGAQLDNAAFSATAPPEATP